MEISVTELMDLLQIATSSRGGTVESETEFSNSVPEMFSMAWAAVPGYLDYRTRCWDIECTAVSPQGYIIDALNDYALLQETYKRLKAESDEAELAEDEDWDKGTGLPKSVHSLYDTPHPMSAGIVDDKKLSEDFLHFKAWVRQANSDQDYLRYVSDCNNRHIKPIWYTEWLPNHVEHLKLRLSNQANVISDLQKQVAEGEEVEFEPESIRLTKQVAQLKAKIVELDNRVGVKVSEYEDLQRDLTTAEQEAATLRAENAKMRSFLTKVDLSKNNADIVDTVLERETESAEMQTRLIGERDGFARMVILLKNENEDLQTELNEARQTAADVNEDNLRIAQSNREYIQEIVRLTEVKRGLIAALRCEYKLRFESSRPFSLMDMDDADEWDCSAGTATDGLVMRFFKKSSQPTEPKELRDAVL